jgi:hypothetical protein
MTIKTVKGIDVVEYVRVEHHSINSHLTMQVSVEVLKECGFTPERFEEVITHLDTWGVETKGEAPKKEEIDRFHKVQERHPSNLEWLKYLNKEEEDSFGCLVRHYCVN